MPWTARRLSGIAAVITATVLITGCTAESQPSAVELQGCETSFWTPEQTCWFGLQPTGQGLETHQHRVAFRLKSPTVEGITVNGAPATAVAIGHAPAVAATAYTTERWEYDEVAAPGQVAHLVGSQVGLVFPGPTQPEGTSFDVVVTYRGWALGDTSETAEVGRRFRFTSADPARCAPRVSVPANARVGDTVSVTWTASGCKQAAVTTVSGTVAGPGGGGAAGPPLGRPVAGAVAEQYVRDAAAGSLGGTVSVPITAARTSITVAGWAWNGKRAGDSATITATTPTVTPTPAPSTSEYVFCATGPNGTVEMMITATSKEEAKAEAERTYQGAGWSVAEGRC